MKNFAIAATSTLLFLSACQTAPIMPPSVLVCDANIRAHVDSQTICFDKSWAQDAFVDGSGDNAKVMILLNKQGITDLKSKINPTSTLPVILNIGDQTFETYDDAAITSGFLVLKPFKSRDDANRIVQLLRH